jgi:hypothetical protein
VFCLVCFLFFINSNFLIRLLILEIINESNDCTSLKQIRKKNQQTDQNLVSIIKQNDKLPASAIDLYTFIRFNLTGK